MKHNLATERPSRALLSRLIDEQGLDAVLNRRSPAFKARGLGEKKLTKSQAIELMLEEPNLMRRPLVLTTRKAIFGYAPDEYDAL